MTVKRKRGVVEQKARRVAAERGYRVRRAANGFITVTSADGKRQYRTQYWDLALLFMGRKAGGE